jgi:23S rRNA (adenine-N6)-dimethyltransferase
MSNNLSISQNFIVDPNLIGRIIDTRTKISGDDTVMDIGAGKGAITFELAQRSKEVIAYELDSKLFQDLKIELAKAKLRNINLINKDFLSEEQLPKSYKVFANIPFNKSAEIVRKLLLNNDPPQECYLFLEKNTAYRFMGINGESLLSLSIAVGFEHSFIWQFDKYDFFPRPDADIVLVMFEKREDELIEDKQIPDLLKFIEQIFAKRKHDLKGALLTVFTFKQLQRIRKDLKLDLKVPPSTLKIIKWVELFKLAKSLGQNSIED